MNDQDHHVLLVEDDELLATVTGTLLSSIATVTHATTAEAALAMLGERPWSLCVVDVELPGMSGLQLLEHIRERAPHACTLVLTGHQRFDFAVQAMRAGAGDYMLKPYDPGALVAKAVELIARSDARRETGRERVLAIGAHPDDVEIGVGGILLRHVAEGHDVTILTLTGGELGGRAPERALESQAAAEAIGARLFLTDLPDTSVAENGDTISTIGRVVGEVKPTVVYTHTSRDVHQDHRNVHNATLVAVRGVRKVFCYQSPSTRPDFLPNRFVPIDDFVHRKVEVIDAYASQTAIRGYLDPELLVATARYWARFTEARYVEPLEVVRDSETDFAAPDRSAELDFPKEVSDVA